MNQKPTKLKRREQARFKKQNIKQINKNRELIKKQFIIKRKLFNKSLFATAVFAILLLAIGITMTTVFIWSIGITLIVVGILQIILCTYMFYQLNWGFANLEIIAKYKRTWILFLITANIIGAIYIGLLIRK